jgi:hypothetical protein
MKIEKSLLGIATLIMSIGLASAAADFDVNTFSCTPGEVAINEVFSCTAQIKNNGDVAGAVNNLRLYPDDDNAWLEQASYLQTSGTSVSPGQTTEVTFSGLRGTKAGNNGFARISLDNEDDTWVADNNVKVNTIDVSVRLTNSASSRASGQTFTTTPEVTAGGNIDVTLTFVVDSGGCSIGNQNSQKSTTGLTDGQKWTPSAWTVTMGTTGNCQFTVSAAATGANGIASKTSSVSDSVTCSSGCSSGTTTSSTGAGGGGGGGIGKLIKSIGELTAPIEQEIGKNEHVAFTFGNINHSISVINLTETTATIVVRSTEKNLTMTVGEEKFVDFENDGKNDISIRLKSINILKKQALFVITPLYVASVPGKEAEKGKEPGAGKEGEEQARGGEEGGGEEISKGISTSKILLILIIVVAIVIIAILILKVYRKKRLFMGF